MTHCAIHCLFLFTQTEILTRGIFQAIVDKYHFGVLPSCSQIGRLDAVCYIAELVVMNMTVMLIKSHHFIERFALNCLRDEGFWRFLSLRLKRSSRPHCCHILVMPACNNAFYFKHVPPQGKYYTCRSDFFFFLFVRRNILKLLSC